MSFAYDANGNVTQRGAQGYVFDIGNRLSAASGIASYVYDGHGRRVREQRADGSVLTSAYTRDGLPRWDSVAGDRIYLGRQLVAQRGSGGYLHTDALGSVLARTGNSLELLGRTRYEPYGATAAGAAPLRIGLAGHVNDPDTALVYMQQRYYEPVAGRFLSVDPVVTDLATGQHFGRYHYAENNPYKYSDPEGRMAWLIRLILAGLAVNDVATSDVPTPGGGGAARSTAKAAEAIAVRNADDAMKAGGNITENAAARATAPYKRPSGATTAAQRESVQGKPCVKCGATSDKQVAGHKEALVKEHYETGTIDKQRMRSTERGAA